MYISGGSNVSPREIEDLIRSHRAVAEACLVGMPDDRWGERGVAVPVARGGHAAHAAAVRRHLDGRLSRYRLPAEIQFREALPKSAYGKVAKADVRKLLKEQSPSGPRERKPGRFATFGGIP